MKGLILTYLLAYGGSLIAPFIPLYGICIYISLAIIKPTETWEWAIPDGPYSKAVALATITGWIFKKFGSWDFGKGTAIISLFAAFVLWAALSMLFVAKHSSIASYYVGLMFKIFLPFLIAMTLIDSEEKLKLLAWTIVLSLGIVAFEENSYYLINGHVPGYIGMNGIAHQMAAGVGLSFFLGLYSQKSWQKWLCWFIAALLSHVPLMHMSRGAMICLVVSASIALYKMPKNKETIKLVFLAILAVSIVAGPSIVEEFGSIFASEEVRDGSAQSRLDLWADMLVVAFENPILGIGPAHWPTVSEQFGWFAGKQGHGLWVQYCAEIGFVGGGLILLFYGVCTFRLLRLSNQFKGQNTWLLAPILGVPASVCGWVVEAQFGSFWTYETPFYIVLLGAATLRVTSTNLAYKNPKETEYQQPLRSPVKSP